MRLRYFKRKMARLFANSGDPDQTPRSAASDLGLHCLSITLIGVSRLQWVSLIKSSYTKYNSYRCYSYIFYVCFCIILLIVNQGGEPTS